MGILATAKKGTAPTPSTTATVVAAPTKTKAVPIVLSAEEQRVNHLVKMHVELESEGVFKRIKEYDAAKKACGEYAKEKDTDDAVILQGTDGYLEYSAKADTTVISDIPKLIEFLGQDVFNNLAKISMTDLKKYLTQSQIDQVTVKEKGSRSLKAVVPNT